MRTRSIPILRSIGWPALLATCAAFALTCAIVAYWSMQLLAPRMPIAPANVVVEDRAASDFRVSGQLFGITPTEAAAQAPASNIQVVGIVVAGARGAALLAIEGKPAKAFTIGEEVTPSRKVVEVRADAVVIDFNGVRSELPAPARGSLAVLTSGVGKTRVPSEAPPPVPGGPIPAVAPPIPGSALAPTAIVPGMMPGMPPPQAAPAQGAPVVPGPVPLPQVPAPGAAMMPGQAIAGAAPAPTPPPAAIPPTTAPQVVTPQPTPGFVPRSQRTRQGSSEE